MSKLQHRGNCQCCGRQHAMLKSGLMAKHGYTVEQGWFQGACSGDEFEPMQISRVRTDEIIAQVRGDVKSLRKQANDFKAGTFRPASVKSGKYVFEHGKRTHEYIPFEEASAYQQNKAIEEEVYRLQSRAKQGDNFADDMEKLADKVNGKPLLEVKIDSAPVAIMVGEQRITPTGLVLTVRHVIGARVYWNGVKASGSTVMSWTGTGAFRKFKLVEKI